jgi:hypothetical protein
MEQKHSLLIAIAIVGCLAVSVSNAAPGGSPIVWAVNDGEKVEKDDLAHPRKARNAAWDGQKIRLFGARNEIVAFQVIVEGGSAGIAQLSVSLRELKQRGGSGRIAYRAPSSDPTAYVGRPIQLFSVHYMQVTTPTRASWIYRQNTPSAPADPLGWKPVQLVPENAKRGKGGFPLRVAPATNQAVWIEVYTARDLPAGVYEGSVVVRADATTTILPVELELFDFTLPDENSMHAMVYYESSQPREYQGRDLDAVYHRFAHRQRIELVHRYSVETAQAAMARFRGGDFTRGRGYEGPGEGVGNTIVPASFYGPGTGYDDRETAWKQSDAWMTFLKQKLPGAITFLYMPDEPRPAQFPVIRQIAENVHSNPGPGKALPIFVTRGYTPDLEGAIDVWCSTPRAYNVERAITERQRGRDYWWYNGGRPAAGAIVIDAPGTDARANIWACFKHQVKVYFYWHGVHWRHNHQKPGEKIQNVWASPITFDSRSGDAANPRGSFANGDGVLMYPGEEKLHPEEDRGIAGPCSTIQLANFRRGLQDHEYLTLARKLGLTAEVERAVQRIVPRVLSAATDTVSFPENGDAYEAVRYELAKAIAAAGGGQATRRP